MSYYGSPMEAEIEKIVRWHERRLYRSVAVAFWVGAFLSWFITSIVWDVMT